MIKHGSVTPPDYDLSNVKSRVILHYSDNDWLSSPIDVDRLFAKLPNAQINHIPDERYKVFFGCQNPKIPNQKVNSFLCAF